LIFDGKPLPIKENVFSERRSKREANFARAQELYMCGLPTQAFKYLQQCLTITPKIIAQVVESFKDDAPKVKCVRAPYESDAQLAFMCQNGTIDLVVTEDSDLIPYGCPTVVYKMSTNGACTIYEKERLGYQGEKFELFRKMCVVAGCDYMRGGIHGIGLKKAERYLTTTVLDEELQTKITNAENTFKHQVVYDVDAQTEKHLNPIVEEEGDYAYLGVVADSTEAYNHANFINLCA